MKILYGHMCDLAKAMLRKKSFNILEEEKGLNTDGLEDLLFQSQYVKSLKFVISNVSTRKSHSNLAYFIVWPMGTKVAEQTTTLKSEDTGTSREPQTGSAYLEKKLPKP